MRGVNEIAKDIKACWLVVSINTLSNTEQCVNGKYLAEDEQSIILYFLANANNWRGEDARRIKRKEQAVKFKILTSKEITVLSGGVSVATVRRLPNGRFEASVAGVYWEVDEKRDNYGEPSLISGRACIVVPSQAEALIRVGLGMAKRKEIRE